MGAPHAAARDPAPRLREGEQRVRGAAGLHRRFGLHEGTEGGKAPEVLQREYA
ncbi:hypothetical protein ACFQ0X_38405 [Streptomyces rectiviolaceus]|uniref:hypothetical protein n=1 Tax=Streptomyces rectiviolaceus TaxID=332591 RepID=UPI0031E30FD5